MLELLILKKIIYLLKTEDDITLWSEEELLQFLDVKANESLDIKEYDLLYAEVVESLEKTYGLLGTLTRLNALKSRIISLIPKYRFLRLGTGLNLLIVTTNHLYSKVEQRIMPKILYALILDFDKMKNGSFDEETFFASLLAENKTTSFIPSEESSFPQISLFQSDSTPVQTDFKYSAFVNEFLTRENCIESCKKILRRDYSNEELIAFREELTRLLKASPSKENEMRIECIRKCISEIIAIPQKKTNSNRNRNQLVLESF